MKAKRAKSLDQLALNTGWDLEPLEFELADLPPFELDLGLLDFELGALSGTPDRTGTDSLQADKAGTSRRLARGGTG